MRTRHGVRPGAAPAAVPGAVLGVVLLLAAALPLAAQEADPAVAAAVRTAFGQYERWVGALNADKWITLWDEQGVKMVPGAAPLVGKAAIHAFVRDGFARFKSRKADITIEQLEQFGDLAIARGSAVSEDQLKTASAPVRTTYWFITLFKKQADGSWKIYRDSIGPVPGAE